MLMQLANQPGLNHGLNQLLQAGKLRAIDLAFADFIYAEEADLTTDARECLSLLAAFVSAQTGEQHSCVHLAKLGQPFAGIYLFPELAQLQAYMQQSRTFVHLNDDANPDPEFVCKPLVVQAGNVYLQRYWQYEWQLASIIKQKAASRQSLHKAQAKTLLNQLFEPNTRQGLDWQKIAVCLAASQSLSFITGGPGTGKTTTVTKLLALLQGLAAAKGNVLNIQLVAPTGKAAARLTESISAAKQKLPASFAANLPQQCQTIHRLLGAKPKSPYFKANAAQPLHLDVLVLDEASMVDLPLMAKLFMALPTNAQVILLGDQEQLASVETGSVLSDICAAGQPSGPSQNNSGLTFSPDMLSHLADLLDEPALQQNINERRHLGQSVIQDNLVRLMHSHRFDQHSGIGQLAKQIQANQAALCIDLLQDSKFADIQWYQPQHNNTSAVEQEILSTLIVKLLPLYKKYIHAVQQGDLAKAFDYLQQQQVLCAQKSGYWGVSQINQLIESELHKQGLIDKHKDFYLGRPVMLSKNDHGLKLFNGDIGIVMPDPQNPSLNKVWFVTPEGQMRGLLPSRLPSLDTLYAMTIHKSQGSEFAAVYLCLPLISANNQGRGLNKELIYTGLTRAKKHFMLCAQIKALHLSLHQQCIRGSGLAERLKPTRNVNG